MGDSMVSGGALVVLAITSADDVFTLRQRGRDAAAALGMDEADQARVATALSEVGREVVACGGSAAFSVARDASLCIEVRGLPAEAAARAVGTVGLVAARRLMDEVSIGPPADDGRLNVTLRKRRSGSHDAVDANAHAGSVLRAAFAEKALGTPLDELLAQNRDLIAALDELSHRQQLLVQLNAELEETNRGVMAMYGQLSGELEETNRGVVALYSELDEKSMQLNQANEAKSRFLANVSHELRSPVNSVLGLARVMLDAQSTPLTAEQTQQVGFILRAAESLLGLVNELLDLAKAESGHLVSTVVDVDLAAVFAELSGELAPLAAPGVDLVVDTGDTGHLSTDRTLLTQVLRNLLSNALKFTPNGQVRLAATSRGEEVEIVVEDTGIGLSAADQIRVFEEFYQVRGPLQVRHKGSGLGLPYARRVAHTLGGDLSVTSDIDQGSRFTVRLPKHLAEAGSTSRQQVLPQHVLPQQVLPQQVPPQHVLPEPVQNGSSARLVELALVVDDDDAFRRTIAAQLHGMVGQVIEARDGREALALLRSAQPVPDVVFLDLRMPDMDGADVLAHIGDGGPGSSAGSLRSPPVVVVSSADLDADARQRLGRATAILSKADASTDTLRLLLSRITEAAAE